MPAKKAAVKKKSEKSETPEKSGSDKTLVIVESPAKAKTINKYLGRNYIVEASVGHIKDLVKFNLGVDPEKDFQPKYVTIRGKADIIKRLKQLASKSRQVLIATDPDREGEAIAWHIAEEVSQKNDDVKRVIFNEITKTGIKKGISEPRAIDTSLFMSQQARRVLDRLIGYRVSPFLSRAMLDKTTQTLSAGRVQSVALRLICEREQQVRLFQPIEYWNIMGDFRDPKGNEFKARLVSFGGKDIKNPEGSKVGATDEESSARAKDLERLHYIRNEAGAKDLLKRIKEEDYSITSINKRKTTRKPAPPFTTSSLQQEASRKLGYPSKRTMAIAQQLYEGVSMGDEGTVGLITYMRTDSMRISPEAQEAAREKIKEVYGDAYLPEQPPVYASKSTNVQDAHEAIRITYPNYTPAVVKKYLKKEEAALYELIYNRFIASQMAPAQIEQTTVNVQGGDFAFRASGSVTLFDGFLAVYEESADDQSQEKEPTLPKGLESGSPVKLTSVDSKQAFTKAPPRYNQASLVKTLDELGIGRPSTYASIVSTLLDREYVEFTNKVFIPTELGENVNEVLVKNFPSLFNVAFTADMEKELDVIAEGDKTYLDVVKEFYGPFTASLKEAEESGAIPEIICEKCGGQMVIKVSRMGRFLGCSNYPECKNTKPLPKPGKTQAAAEPQIAPGIKCDICGKDMLIRESKYGKFYGCVDYPNCKGVKPLTLNHLCPKCGKGSLTERFSPKTRKKFWGCTNYPDCNFLTNYEPYDQPCEKCDSKHLEIRYKKVPEGFEKYLACPKCKAKYEFHTEPREA
ncbi:MAG: type I DNA topoisomerase [Chloroflexota bacterium]